MKKIVGLDAQLEKLSENDREFDTFKNYFRGAVALGISKPGNDATDAFEVALLIKRAGNEVELEDAQFKLVRDRVSENPGQWVDWIKGQLIKKLDEAEKK